MDARLEGLGVKPIGNRRATLTATISTSVDRYNLRTALGNPVGVYDVIVNVTASGECYSLTTATAGFRIGAGWTAGCAFRINNAGRLRGCGGGGGNGASDHLAPGGAGGAGGDAMWLDGQAVSIDNGAGYIEAGGGGGGGGGNGFLSGSGGGGGGAGKDGGPGGNGGSGGGSGFAGTTSAGGAGGQPVGSFAGWGGWGGAPGAGGGGGGDGSGGNYSLGGPGGAAGKAVYLGGGSVTWLAGNNATQVKGAVA